WTLPGQRRSGIRLRSGRLADHHANMDLLCCANRALRRRVYSSLRAGTWPRHSSGKACRARRSQGNRVTTVNRSGRQMSLTSIELQQVGGRGKEFCGEFRIGEIESFLGTVDRASSEPPSDTNVLSALRPRSGAPSCPIKATSIP